MSDHNLPLSHALFYQIGHFLDYFLVVCTSYLLTLQFVIYYYKLTCKNYNNY